MSNALQSPMTLSEFLAWEERQEMRYEFDGTVPRAMNGGTINHDSITFNIRTALAQRLAGTPCRPLGPNVKIQVQDKIRYPDCFGVCRPLQGQSTVAESPMVVFEVVSRDTARTDRIEKLREYQATASIQRYVIVEQRSIGALVLARHGDHWRATAVTDGDRLEMPEIRAEVPLAEFYRDVDFGDPDVD